VLVGHANRFFAKAATSNHLRHHRYARKHSKRHRLVHHSRRRGAKHRSRRHVQTGRRV
jgi:hypothetical protein